MRKSENTVSDIFVKKLNEKMWKLLLRSDLVEIWTLAWGSKSRSAYGIGKAKNQGIIHSIGTGIFIVEESKKPDFDEIYWQIIALLIREYSPSGAIIAHEKSMELHLRNYEIPEKLVLYTRDTDKRIPIGWYQVEFRTLKTWEKTGVKNMYHILKNMSEEIMIDGVKLRHLSLEASLLDVGSLRHHETGIAESLILRFLAKYATKLSREVLGELVNYRYIRAINRIRALTKTHGYEKLYEDSLDIIRREWWGCYLSL